MTPGRMCAFLELYLEVKLLDFSPSHSSQLDQRAPDPGSRVMAEGIM